MTQSNLGKKGSMMEQHSWRTDARMDESLARWQAPEAGRSHFHPPQEAESETRKWGGTINTQKAPLVIIPDTQDLENLPRKLTAPICF